MKPILTTLAFILIAFSGFSQDNKSVDQPTENKSVQKTGFPFSVCRSPGSRHPLPPSHLLPS